MSHKFNAAPIVEGIAALAAAGASLVQTIIEQREAAGDQYDPEAAVEAVAEGIAARVTAGDLDTASAKVKLSKVRRMLECDLDILVNAAALSGGSINGTVTLIRQATGPKPGAGAGRPKGKPEAKPAAKSEAKPEGLPNVDSAWMMALETMRAKAPGRKAWPSEDIVAFQESAARMLALLKRNAPAK